MLDEVQEEQGLDVDIVPTATLSSAMHSATMVCAAYGAYKMAQPRLTAVYTSTVDPVVRAATSVTEVMTAATASGIMAPAATIGSAFAETVNFFQRCRAFAVDTLEYWRDLGRRAAEAVCTPQFLVGVVALLAIGVGTSLAIAYATRPEKREVVEQGDDFEKPTPLEKERPDVWRRKDFPTFEVPVSQYSRTTNQEGGDRFRRCAAKCCYYAETEYEVDGEKKGKAFRVLALKGHFFLLNAHNLPPVDFKISLFQFPDQNVSPNRIGARVSFKQCVVSKERDLAVIYVANVAPQPNSIQMMPPSYSKGAALDGEYIVRDKSGEARCVPVHNAARMRQPGLHPKHPEYEDFWRGMPIVEMQMGECGSPLVLHTAAGSTIVGLHSLFSEEGTSSCAPVDQVCVSQLVAQCSERVYEGTMPCVAQGCARISTTKTQFKVGPVHYKSPVHWLEQGMVRCYGSNAGFRPNYTSQVCSSLTRSFWEDRGFSTNKVAPDLGWRPYYRALVDLAQIPDGLDPETIKECARAFLEDIWKEIPHDPIKPYDRITAINGADGVSFVNSIDMSTSAGSPWYRSKRDLLQIIGVEKDKLLYDVVPEVQEMIDHIYSCYDSGVTALPMFVAKAKDEPISEEKALNGDSRIFTASPLHFTIVVRQYYLPLIRLIQNHKFAFESGPGMVCQSKEWNDLFRYLTKFGKERIIAGDYSKFDKRQECLVLHWAFWILVQIAQRLGYSEISIQRMWAAAQDIMQAFVDFNGTLLQFVGMNPSGHPLTVIINGLVNSLYFRYAYFFLHPKRDVKQFREHVALMTYGDDNVAGVSDQAPWFNHTAVQRVLAEAGIKYTMAEKGRESIPYISIDEATFLKRKFVCANFEYRGERAILCPLDWASFGKTLLVGKASKIITPKQREVQALLSVHAEMYFHGVREFEVFDTQLRECARLFSLDLGPLPTYQEYQERWLDASVALDM